MTRRISVLFVLTIFLISLVGMSAFAAKAKSVTSGIARGNGTPISSWTPAKVDGGDDVSSNSQGEAEITPASFGDFIDMGFNPSHVLQIGSTYYDYQKNGSMGRQITIGGGDYGGAGSGTDSTWVHNVYMKAPAAANANRVVVYYAHRLTVGTTSEDPSLHASTGAGYITVAYDPTGTGPGALDVGAAVVAYHLSPPGTYIGRDFGLAQSSFAIFAAPPAPNCSGTISQPGATEGTYIWPTVDVDVVAGAGVAYAMGSESVPAGTIEQSIIFYKSNSGITGMGPTCGRFIDSVHTISPVVVADPASNKVAIFWCKPRDAGGDNTQFNNDVVYIESTDNGTTWPSAGTYTNITNYATAATGRAYTEVAAIYSGGCLHAIWPNTEYDSLSGQVPPDRPNKLFHWDDCSDCISLVTQETAPDDATCSPGVWNKNIAKVNISECISGGTRLYVTYTRFTANSGVPISDDCSLAGYANGEIYAQTSSTGGVTWGPPTNLTNTKTNNCALGACNSEHWSSCAPYNRDSLRIQYINDKDAGGIVQTEGGWTNSPVMNMDHPCFTMTTFASLGATPSEYSYPTHTSPGGTTDTVSILTNAGNTSTTYAAAPAYNGSWGTGSITFLAGSGSGSVPAGCTNSANLQILFTGPSGPSAQGLYTATINVTYPNEERAVLAIPVELYNFTNFFLPQEAAIRTSCNRLFVVQETRSGDGEAAETGRSLSYFADNPAKDYLFDGSLVIGNSATNLSWSLFAGGSGAPTPSNPFGPLYAMSDNVYDSTGSTFYRKATGKGTNRDSSICFDVNWFAPKHPDSCDFYILCFRLYAGPKDTLATINNLTVAYAVDFDVPSDTGSDNTSGFDEDLQMVYQQGAYAGANTTRFAALAGRERTGLIPGAFVWDNPSQVYPLGTFENDSIWNKIQNNVGYEAFTDSITDLNSVVILDRGLTIFPRPFEFFCYVIIAAQPSGGTLAGLKGAVTKAQKFLCDHVDDTPDFCTACNSCGDADGDLALSISDAVFLIQYIFAGGPPPGDCNYTFGLGDADGDGSISISDAVYLIQYIFAGGPAPHCQ